MNTKLVAVSLVLLGLWGQSALANVVHLVNQSPKQEPLRVEYRIAQSSGDGQIKYSPTIRTNLAGQNDVMVNLGNYKYAGVVLVSVDGHVLPGDATLFGKEETCTIATDKNHPDGQIAVVKKDKTLSCSHAGGIIIR